MIGLLTAQAGVTLTPALLALGALLVAALGALLGGAAAWGRFDATLTQLRADHKDLAVRVERATADGAEVAALRQRVADQGSEIAALRQKAHDQAATLARLAERLDGFAGRLGHAEDDLRRSHAPSTR